MSKWMIWCLIICDVYRVNIAAGIRNLRQTPLADEKIKTENNLKKPFLNITDSEDAKTALQIQFVVMMADKHVFPWDDDENTNKRNHEVATATAEMIHKLHAMSAAYEIIDGAYSKTRRMLEKSVDTLPNAVTVMCDYIEQGFRNMSILNSEYQTMKDNIKTKLGNGTFAQDAYFEQFYNGIENSEKFLAIINTAKIIKLFSISRMFVSESECCYSENSNLTKFFIKMSQEAENSTVRDQWQNIYDKQLVKLAEDVKFVAENRISFKGDTFDISKAKIMILSELLKGMKKAVNENSVLKNLHEVKSCPLFTSDSDEEMKVLNE